MNLKTIKQLKDLVESRKRREEQSYKQAQLAQQAHLDRAEAHKTAALSMSLEQEEPLTGGDLHAFQNHMVFRAHKADEAREAATGLNELLAERRAALQDALRAMQAWEGLEEKKQKEEKALAQKKEEQTREEFSRLKAG